MKEVLTIVEEFEKTTRDGKAAALATVVQASGSTYRHPGARMLMTQEGHSVGSISGGCLEADVFERAQEVMVSGEPVVVTYDTTSDTDIVWGLGLGCNGLVRVLIERLAPQSQPAHLAFLAGCFRSRQMGVLATVFRVAGQVQENVGARLMLQLDGSITNQIENSALVSLLLADAGKVLCHKQSTVKSYQLATGEAEVFIEVIQPPVALILFGAGHDAVAVARLAKELGWQVTVVDNRQSNRTLERFSQADAIVLCRPERIQEHITMDNRTVAVVMTHNYLHDLELLKTLLPSPLCYLGVLGPKSRTERLLHDLLSEGMVPIEKQLRRLYGPCGLDIGADTSEEIALSIMAEIQSVLTNRFGGFLRDRKGPIHSQSEDYLRSEDFLCLPSVS